jgi:1,4-dihydroxy-2-naphthoate octaprenyltransferase
VALLTVRPWILAARPRTLTAAVVPVLVGSAQAFRAGDFDWRALALALGAALAIQVAANFANDVSDARRGADPADRVGPPRMVATGVIEPRRMWVGVWTAVAVAGMCALGLASIAGPWVLVIGVVSVLAMLGYVGGPFPYGYRGWGEVFVFIFFGLVATAGSRFVHGGRVDAASFWLAVPVGMLAAAILVANNLRDLDTDARAGKRTLAVRMGPDATRRLYRGLVFGAPVVTGLGAAVGVLGPWTALTLVTLVPAARLARAVEHAAGPAQLAPSLGATARLQFLFGLLLAAATAAGPGA